MKLLLAEKEGFEPPDLLQSTVFKTAAFDRSAISPVCRFHYLIASANIRTFFGYANLFLEKKHLFLVLTFKCFIFYTLGETYFCKKLDYSFNTLRILLFPGRNQSFRHVLFPQYWIPILFLRYQYHAIFEHRYQNLYCR